MLNCLFSSTIGYIAYCILYVVMGVTDNNATEICPLETIYFLFSQKVKLTQSNIVHDYREQKILTYYIT